MNKQNIIVYVSCLIKPQLDWQSYRLTVKNQYLLMKIMSSIIQFDFHKLVET